MEKIPTWEPPERPWFKIGKATEKQEEAIRDLAGMWGFVDLRGFWKFMESIDYDYYNVVKDASPQQ